MIYENVLIITNILKIDEDYIILLKQANSNVVKSSVTLIKRNDTKGMKEIEEVKINDLKIAWLDSNTNILYLIREI